MMKRFVIDTNILLIALPRISTYRPIFEALLNGRFKLVVSEAIIQEYIEVIARKTTPEVAYNVEQYLQYSPYVIHQEVYYKWNLITIDPDDNKFVDTAIAGNVDAIVTNDKHFNHLKTIRFPKLTLLSANTLLQKIQQDTL